MLNITVQAYAQQKIGYVNTDVILNKIPEYKGVQHQLQVLSRQWKAKLDSIQQRIDTLKENFQAKKILYSDQVRREKQHQINVKVKEKKQYLNQKFGADGDYFKKQKQLLKPIQQKVYNAISTIAQKENFDFVFDRAQNTSLLFGRKEWNLNQAVLKELGVKINKGSN